MAADARHEPAASLSRHRSEHSDVALSAAASATIGRCWRGCRRTRPSGRALAIAGCTCCSSVKGSPPITNGSIASIATPACRSAAGGANGSRARERVPLPTPSQPRERWSMDFMLDTLGGRPRVSHAQYRRRFHARMSGDRSRPIAAWARVVRVLERLRAARPAADDRHGQRTGVCGPDARRLGLRARRHAPLHPAGQADRERVVESFNGKFRDECLNEHWFVNMVDAQAAIEAWRLDYNTVRPHSSLHDRTPDQFARLEGARRLSPPRPTTLKPGRTHIIRVADFGGRSSGCRNLPQHCP